MSTSFIDLGVPPRMADALASNGIVEAFPVQALTLPDTLAGRDLCGRAPTGSGKTLGFGIPMLARVGQASPNRPTGLVLVPTRELADQVQRAFVPLGRAAWRFVQAIYGGAPMGPQIHSLRKGASVIVATPGRLIDIIEQGHCDLGAIEVVVIDEADRMADLGFMPDVRKILDMTPSTRQTMLWSATLDGDVNELVAEYLTDPARHDLVGEVVNGPVEHRFVVQPAMERLDATAKMIGAHGPTVVFVKTRFGVDDVTAGLMNAGVRAGSLHGARSQAARQRTLDDFKRGRIQALVATDVAARGIHVDDVELVVHYDLPDNDKDYQHRSGRTGRAGKSGTVVAFVPPSRQRVARRLAESVEAEITWVQGTTPDRGDRQPFRRPDRAERPSYDDRGPRPYGDAPRGPRTDDRGPRRYGDAPRGPRTDDRQPFRRPDRAERPSYDDRGPRPSYDDRGPRPYGDAPRGPRTDDRGPRRYGDAPRGARPFAPGGRRSSGAPQRPGGGRPAR